MRTQLITDLDKFVEQYDKEEELRLKEVEAERQRKEEQTRRWAEAQQKKRDEFERSNIQPAAAVTDSTAKGRALELLRQQAAAQPQRENPAVLRAKSIAALDATMREAFRYLAELVAQVNNVMPRASRPYEFIYLGKLPARLQPAGAVPA